jgi:REP element-mobilizing transposase RayT
MPNTYTQIHLHIIYAVQYRNALLNNKWKDELYKFITGIVQDNEHKMIIINGMPDHTHMLIGMRPTQSLSDLMKEVKGSSSKWINEKRFAGNKFNWQSGYGAFSYSISQLQTVINYIKNQEAHHQKRTFLQEYRAFLEKFEVPFEERYIFHQPE